MLQAPHIEAKLGAFTTWTAWLMSAVIDEQQDMGWWAYTWQEHRGLIIAFSLLALSLIVLATFIGAPEYGC